MDKTVFDHMREIKSPAKSPEIHKMFFLSSDSHSLSNDSQVKRQFNVPKIKNIVPTYCCNRTIRVPINDICQSLNIFCGIK